MPRLFDVADRLSCALWTVDVAIAGVAIWIVEGLTKAKARVWP